VLAKCKLTETLTACATRTIPGFPVAISVACPELFSVAFESIPALPFALFLLLPFLFFPVLFGERKVCSLGLGEELGLWGVKVGPAGTRCGVGGLTLAAASFSSFCFRRSVSMDIG
jgi:hypothetical protein